MSDDITAPWMDGVSVTEMTHTDLDENRVVESGITDTKFEKQRLIETLVQATGLTRRGVPDRAMRVELADAIDNYRVSFDRDEYDIAYMIPPTGWVASMTVYNREIVDPDAVDDYPQSLSFSTTPTVKAMAEAAVEENEYETKTAVVVSGLKRLLGRLDE